MAKVIGVPGEVVVVGGTYGCSERGHRIELEAGKTFPTFQHPEKPWTLMVAD